MRRVETANVLRQPRLEMPKTARKRRRRNQRQALPLQTVRQILLSARWISLALLAMCVYALYLIGMSEQFYLTTIPVEGTFSITPNEVVQSSGLAGVHIFAADPNQAAENVTEVAGVIAATVTLEWPNQVTIHIEEDSPIAIWAEGETEYWVTKNGQLIPARTRSLGLLKIQSNLLSESNEAGEVVSNADFVPAEVLEGALLLKALRPNIETLSYRPSSGLSYQDGRGWQAYFGTGTDIEQKLVVYETIVEQLTSQGLTPVYISVSNQEKPYYLAQEG